MNSSELPKVETDKTKQVAMTIQFWKSWGGASKAEYAKTVITNYYPLATFELIADEEKTKNVTFSVNGTVVFDKIKEGGKNFKEHLPELITRIKAVAEA